MNFLELFAPGPVVMRFVILAALQATVVIVVVAFVSRFLFRRNAAVRHGLWLGALIWGILTPAAVALSERLGLQVWSVGLPFSNARSVEAVATNRADAVDEVVATGEKGFARSTTHADPSTDALVPDVALASTATLPRKANWRNAVGGSCVLLWSVGVILGIVRAVVGIHRLSRLSRATRRLEESRYGQAFAKVRERLGVSRLPAIMASDAVAGPIAIGWIQPGIVLPAGLAESLTERELCDVLVHEGAHWIRRDVWVGMMQRVAGSLFWPYPLIHYVNGQLARAREEVCDNFVLRSTDACDYARTLVALTEICRPAGSARPALGLLGDRWTLASRVAGLVDTKRDSRTHVPVLIKIVGVIAIAAIGMLLSAIRWDPQARADAPEPRKPENVAAPEGGAPNVKRVEGIVVDERGQAVAGATVRALFGRPPESSAVSGADGRFTLRDSLGRAGGFIAETAGGTDFGVVRYPAAREFRGLGLVRVVVKPGRPLKVQVNDAGGAPIPDAVVEANTRLLFSVHAKTDAEGSATLRVPADQSLNWVVAFKSGRGFDFFADESQRPAGENTLVPNEVALVLDGARTVRIKAVDSQGDPVPGVVIAPERLPRSGRLGLISNLARGVTMTGTTDQNGVAVFDWLPKGVALYNSFEVRSDAFFCPEPPILIAVDFVETTFRMLRKTRLSGTVRFRDGRPAPGVLVSVSGTGAVSTRYNSVPLTTDNDGVYTANVAPNLAYMVGVIDDAWAAPIHSGVIVREGQPRDGIDFTLDRGTLLHGRVTAGPDQKPSVDSPVGLRFEGGPLPRELGGPSGERPQLVMLRNAFPDADGRYQFRVGPGRYTLIGPRMARVEPTVVEVKEQPEIVQDFALKELPQVTYITGTVIEKTPAGNRPVSKAIVFCIPVGGSSSGPSVLTDEQGRFKLVRQLRVIDGFILLARSADGTLGAFTPVNDKVDGVTVVIASAAQISGRVMDTNGKPQAKRRLGFKLNSGSDYSQSAHLVVGLMTDDMGRFVYKGAPVGSDGEILVPHLKDGRPTGVRTTVGFNVQDAQAIELPDLVIPPADPGS